MLIFLDTSKILQNLKTMIWPKVLAFEFQKKPLVLFTLLGLNIALNTGSGTNNTPFYYKIFYYKIISMLFCNITISLSSTPYDILGKMFKLKL